jgi:hypothetical protein
MAVEPVLSIEHHKVIKEFFGVDHLNLNFDDDILHHLVQIAHNDIKLSENTRIHQDERYRSNSHACAKST